MQTVLPSATRSQSHRSVLVPTMRTRRTLPLLEPPRRQVIFCVRGVISPALANCALDGLERLLQEKYPAGKRLKSLGGENPVSISSVTRMTSSSPVNRKNYWQEKSSPWSSSSCKNEVLNSLRQRPSLRTWSTALISSDKMCAGIPTGNCSSCLPRRMLEPS